MDTEESHVQVTLDGSQAWTFLRSFSIEETHEYTHGLHLYPAKIVPQIARELIRRYSKKGSVVLDPFCGSGGVLVESLIAGRSAIGVDVNRLALLLAKVKTTSIDETELREKSRALQLKIDDMVNSWKSKNYKPIIPDIPNLTHWFKPYVISELGIIKAAIEEISEDKKDIKDFFSICFSSTMYKVSNIRHHDNPFFTRILHKNEMKHHRPNVVLEFAKTLERSVISLVDFNSVRDKESSAKIIYGDSRELWKYVGKDVLVDLIVTSPPYGEEANTMDYNRFSKLALYWLGLGDSISISKKIALGSSNRKERIPDFDLKSSMLDKALTDIQSKSAERALEVKRFFVDYFLSLREMHNVLKLGAVCCVVIGDRTASGIPIRNGDITAELSESLGFKIVERLRRKMYMYSLRSNVVKYENIVIMEK